MILIIDSKVCPSVAHIPIINRMGRSICHSGTEGVSTSAIRGPISTCISGMGIVTVSCIVMTQNGRINEATAVSNSTIRFTRWNVSRLSNRR